MKNRTIAISILLIMSAFIMSIGQPNLLSEPHLEATKNSAPSLIYAEGKGFPDMVEVNITVWGAGDPIGQIFPQDVVFLIDTSGSMGLPHNGYNASDPDGLRIKAAKYYLDQLKSDLFERAAVIDFAGDAFLVPKYNPDGDHLSWDYIKVKNNIDLTNRSIGATNIPAAIEESNKELINHGWSNHTLIAILLTDGQSCCPWYPYNKPCRELDEQMDDPNDPLIKEAILNDITYFTIGLGEDVNVTLLSNLANMTGGSYHPAASAEELQKIYDLIHKEIISTAGKGIQITETLTTEFDFVNGSFSKVPNTLSGKTAKWDIPSLSINESWSVTFEASTTECGPNQQIDTNTTVTYTSYNNETATLVLDPVYVEVIGCYQPPVSDAGGPYFGIENSPITLNGSGSYDPDGYIVSYDWDLDDDGAYDDASGEVVQFVWNDDYVNVVGLRVTDDTNLSDVSYANISVMNVDPTAELHVEMMNCAIGLRVAGSKWSNVNMTLYEDGIEVGFIEVERWPGSPDKNPSVGSMPSSIDLNKSYEAVVMYDPYPDDDDEIKGNQGNNGKDKHDNAGNPVWITLECDGGSKWIHHTFNTQQSKKRDSDHWNHVEPWYVDIKEHLVGFTFNVVGHATDPGSDDIMFEWSYGSQTAIHTHLNGVGPDPYYSPYTGTAPIELNDIMTFVYEGAGTITVAIHDDDEGRPTDTSGYNSASCTIG